MLRRFTKPFLLVLVLFGLAELVTRTFFARSMSGRFDYGYHPTAGFQENADGTLKLVRAGGRRFHPQQFARKRPPGTLRIMVFGDSVPRGPSLEAAYPAQIQKLLTQQGVNAEAWNLAVPGYGAHRTHLVLRKALEYEPDLVILHLNDSNEYEDEREWKRSQEFNTWHPRNWLMKSLVLRRLREMKTERVFWRWLPEDIRRQSGVHDVDAEISAGMDAQKLRQWRDNVRKYLQANVEACRAKGVPLLVITQARLTRHPTTGGVSLEDNGLDELASLLTAPDVTLVSMKTLFAEAEFAPLFADSSHLRANGHEFLAKKLVSVLGVREGMNRPN